MTPYRTDFVDGGYAGDIYNDLLKDGIAPKDIDIGYDTVEGQTGAHDGVINDREVVGFLYERWTKYQSVLKEKTPFIVPWTLGDDGPEDKFPRLARRKVRRLVTRAREAAVKKGHKAGSRGYVRAVAKEIYRRAMKDPSFFGKVMPADVKCDDTSETGVSVVPATEATALEFLKTHIGSCTEEAKVMLAIFAHAGINARPISVMVDDKANWINHVTVQIEEENNRWTTVDVSMRKFDPHYKSIIPLTMNRFASMHYITLLIQTQDERNLDRGDFLSPWVAETMMSRYLFQKEGIERGLRILNDVFNGHEDPRPDTHYLDYVKYLGSESAYKRAIDDVLKRNPRIAGRLINELIREFEMSNVVSAFYLPVARDLARTPKEKSDAAYASARHEALINNLGKAREHTMSMLDIDSSDATFERAVSIMTLTGDIEGAYEIGKRWIAANPGNVKARQIMTSFSYDTGDFDGVIRFGESLAEHGDLSIRSAAFFSIAHAKKGDVARAIKTFDDYMAEKDEDHGQRQLYAILRAFLALASGDTRGFHRRQTQNRVEIPCESLRKIYEKRGYPEVYRRHAEAIDLFLRGNKKAAMVKKAQLLAKPDGRKSMDNFLKTFDFLPKEAIGWLAVDGL